MRDGVKWLAGLVLSVALVAGAQARINPAREGGASGPYRAITDRNIFGLVHIDPNASVVVTATPPPNVQLVGLFNISGHPQGVFAISEPGPGAKAAVNQILEVDQRKDGVEVLALDLAAKTAKIQVGDNETPTTIKLVEPKPVTTGVVVGALPGAPTLPGGRPPGFPPNRTGFTATPSGFNNSPAYNNSMPGAFNPNANLNPATGGDSGSLPNRQVRTDSDAPPMSAEQQMYNMEIQRAAAREAGSPIADLLPVTPFTPPAQTQDPTTQQQQPPNPSLTPTQQQPAYGTRINGKNVMIPGGQ